MHTGRDFIYLGDSFSSAPVCWDERVRFPTSLETSPEHDFSFENRGNDKSSRAQADGRMDRGAQRLPHVCSLLTPAPLSCVPGQRARFAVR